MSRVLLPPSVELEKSELHLNCYIAEGLPRMDSGARPALDHHTHSVPHTQCHAVKTNFC